MAKLNHFLCGNSTLRAWDDTIGTFGTCALNLVIDLPLHLIFATASAFVAGHLMSSDEREEDFVDKKKRKLAIVVRFLTSFVIFLAFVANTLTEGSRISFVNLAADLFRCVAWFVHLTYLNRLGRASHKSSRGPLVMVVIFVALVVLNFVNLYSEYAISDKFRRATWKNVLPIFIMIMQIAYTATLVPSYQKRLDYFINGFSDRNQLLDMTESFHETLGEESANLLSKLSFHWVNTIMKKGFKRQLRNVSDLFPLPDCLRSSGVHENFEAIAEAMVTKPFWRKLVATHYVEFLVVGLLKFASDILSFGGPIVINKLLLYLESDEAPSKYGFYCAGVLLGSVFLSSLLNSLFNFYIGKTTLKVRSSIVMSVYKKIFGVPADVLSDKFSDGELVNFISTDSDRITNFCPSLLALFSCPLQLVVTLVLLHQQLGVSSLAGVAFAIALLPINKWICNRIGVYSTKMMAEKDLRIKLVSEVLSGIRVIKMHSWEELFEEKIEAIRKREVGHLKKRKYLDAFCVYFWATTPVLISLLTFSCYVLLGNELTAAKVFTSLALFNMLIMPLNAFPWVLNGLVEAFVSVKRLQNFFDLENLDMRAHYNATLSSSDDLAILQKAVFSRIGSSTRPFVLGPLDLKISPAMFIGVIGTIGSGKSTLLRALIGEVPRAAGTLAVSDFFSESGIGYISQEAWIQNTTIRENILFGKVYDYSRYQNVLEACALNADLKELSHGDGTLAGDRGASLSGGQKSRIALARALYQDFDIYLLDDPFANVDAIVRQTLYQCLTTFLANKTRVVCTHFEQYLQQADLVVKLDHGQVARIGTPAEVFEPQADSVAESNYSKTETQKSEVVSSPVVCSSDEIVGEETSEQGTIKFPVYKAYGKAIGFVLSAIVLFSMFFMQITRSSSDLWLAYWTSKSDKSNFTASLYLEVFGGIAVVNSVATLLRAFLFAFSGIVAALSVHKSLLRSVLRASAGFFDGSAFGKSLNRFSSDTFNVDDALPFTLNIFLAQSFSLLASLLVTVYGLPWIALLIVALGIPYYFIQRYYRWTSRELKRLSSVTLTPLYSHLVETFSGLTAIRCYRADERFVRDMYLKLDANTSAQYSSRAASEWLNLRLQMLGVAVTSSVAFAAVSLHFWSIGKTDAGLIGLALAYSLSLTGLLNGVIQSFTQVETDMVSVERIEQFVNDIPRERSVGIFPEDWPLEGCVVFANVSLRYAPRLPLALKNVTFTVKPKEHVGIVGRTGSGKSSLFRVLFGLNEPDEGTVLIDNISIKEVALKALRTNIFIIPQDPFLFSGTIRENLDPLDVHPQALIWKALKDSHAEELVLTLGGLNTKVTSSGSHLSCGQKQLLCLARAVLYSAKVVCLDEATASIDRNTDALIRETVKQSMKDATVFIIAHKIESVRNCDKVIVMDKGSVAELDSPDRLIQNPASLFHRLWTQSSDCNRSEITPT